MKKTSLTHGETPKLTPLPFYFLRHGETEWNKSARYQGSRDIPLNEAGLNQVHAVKSFLGGTPISHIFSSHLLRAKRTAEVINEELSVQHSIKKNLRESCFGILEGTDITAQSRQIVQQWMAGKTHTEAEPYQDFASRVINAVNECVRESLSGIPLIVSHGGAFATLTKPMGYQTPMFIGNCELVLCEPPASGNLWRIVSLNRQDID
ncbi:MAG: histidine phosphatase family protein [Pseudomonadota bacterium]